MTIGSDYTPRPSAWTVAYDAIAAKGKEMTIAEAKRCIEVTPGCRFPATVTLDDVLSKLQTWRLLLIENDIVKVLCWENK